MPVQAAVLAPAGEMASPPGSLHHAAPQQPSRIFIDQVRQFATLPSHLGNGDEEVGPRSSALQL